MMAKINHCLAIVVWLAVCVALAGQSDPMYGFVFFVPFSLGPHAVSHLLCLWIRSRRAATLLGVGMLAYAAWFFFVYADAFYFNLDAQSAIAMLYVGIVTLPVMIPVWLIAIAMETSAKKRAGGDGSAAAGA